jgi:hypothetical protein
MSELAFGALTGPERDLAQLEADLNRLEDELAALEDAHDFENGPSSQIEDLIEEIADLSLEIEGPHQAPPPRPPRGGWQMDHARLGARLRGGTNEELDAQARARENRQRKRKEKLQAEWERWRYQRSKLPPEQRGPMMEPGQRECNCGCGEFFIPTTLRHRYLNPTHAQRAYEKRSKLKGRP